MGELRVFIADDHAIVREGLKALIGAQPGMRVAGEAADGREACRRVMELQPDVAVMDISMPGWSGSEATGRLRQVCPGVRILTLTVHEDEGYLRGLLGAGASGYVLKRSATEGLVHAIRTVAAGGIYIDPNLADRLVNAYIDTKPDATPSERCELTGRESEVVRLIALGHSNKEIAARLEISIKTVETHKARSLEKLGLHSRAELVRYALQHGWLVDAPDEPSSRRGPQETNVSKGDS
ncbi:MAG: response regulator transcription factor [Singulisphaera sp.]|nr:response regulator transcription factor [Singulisphaera sp.]